MSTAKVTGITNAVQDFHAICDQVFVMKKARKSGGQDLFGYNVPSNIMDTLENPGAWSPAQGKLSLIGESSVIVLCPLLTLLQIVTRLPRL
jgi:hypothetical protein